MFSLVSGYLPTYDIIISHIIRQPDFPDGIGRITGMAGSGAAGIADAAGLGDQDIADPWYTRDFSGCLAEMERACYGLFEELTGVVFLDFRHSADIPALYEELRSKMEWEPWYGENLDALYDILTGLPHRGRRFVLLLPEEDAPAEVRLYAERIRRVFQDCEEENGE